MDEFLSRFNAGEMIALVSVVGGLLVGLVTIIAMYCHKIRKAEIDNRLKLEMLDRGMSVEEIQAVMAAGKTPSDQ
jgi:hypothetical protein